MLHGADQNASSEAEYFEEGRSGRNGTVLGIHRELPPQYVPYCRASQILNAFPGTDDCVRVAVDKNFCDAGPRIVR